MYPREAKKALASQMQHYVYIQTRTRTSDGEGGYTDTWTTTSSAIPAAISPIQARQLYQFRSIDVDATHLIRMRGRTTIDDSGIYQILFGERVFEVLTVENIQERNFEKVITCKERR
jgi:head-tail adaptor